MGNPTDDLLLAVGHALRTWGMFELMLAQLFGMLSDYSDYKKAYAIFETIISFETRVDILDALMALEGLTPLEHETWRRFSSKIRKNHKKRHELAHFSVLNYVHQETGQE